MGCQDRVMRRGISLVLVGLLGGAAALLALGMDTLATGSVGPGRVTVRAHWGTARTELKVPPLGRVSASNHRMPVPLPAQVDHVDVDRLHHLHRPEAPGDRPR